MSQLTFDIIKEAFLAELRGEVQVTSDILFEAEAIGFPMPSDSRAAPHATSDTHFYRRASRLPDLIDQAKQSATLGAYIRRKAHQSDKVTYRAAAFEQGQISRDYWSKLLNDEIKPSKEKMLRVAVLLKLNNEESEEMLAKAGYAMSPTDLRDVVVSYCLREGHYDFVVIEQLLADHEIQSLFNDRKGS
ncbi:hypothetical protein [Cohnella yongneupensis]|uniref:Regulatory protein RecX n=1 Tax=Cohnella yongneupensis TaxID=425006 RepID=A0ABW0R4B3_9BACL